MTGRKTYGLMPCVWRRLRAKHPGMALIVYDRNGLAIGTAFLGRYEPLVTLPEAMDFKAISWRQTIERTNSQTYGMLGPTPIAICARTWS